VLTGPEFDFEKSQSVDDQSNEQTCTHDGGKDPLEGGDVEEQSGRKANEPDIDDEKDQEVHSIRPASNGRGQDHGEQRICHRANELDVIEAARMLLGSEHLAKSLQGDQVPSTSFEV